MHKDVERVLLSEEKIKKINKRVADEINRDYGGGSIVCICILKGSMIFAADLMRLIDADVRFDVMQVSSYGSGTVSSGSLKIKKDLSIDISGAEVIVIEDIVDSGITMSRLIPYLTETKNAASVKVCSMLSKPSRREVDVPIDYLGAEIPDEFVIGYGLDYNDKYRNLPYIGVLKRECYE